MVLGFAAATEPPVAVVVKLKVVVVKLQLVGLLARRDVKIKTKGYIFTETTAIHSKPS